MPKRKGKNFVFDDGEDEDREDSVAIIDDDDDDDDDDGDEANEDLSLKILEKALSRRDVGNKLDSGVVSTFLVNGGTSKGKNAESKKKMKINKLDAAHKIPIVWKDQYVDKVVDDALQGEEEDDEVEKSAETKTGETSTNLVLKKLLRGARYFDPCDAGWVSCCYSCGEQGHTTVNCPTPTKRMKPCFICGSLEHGAKQCSKGHDCYICNKSGHRAKYCPDKYKIGSKDVCLRCGGFGHDMILCNYEYSQEDLKDIQCYVCKSFGHLCCIEPDNSLSWAVSCYRCGRLGHTGLACGRHYDEISENDYVNPSCFKCGEEKHISRECPNSSSIIRTSRGRDLPSLCYKCKGAGHLARECPDSSQDKWDTHLTRNFNLMQCIDQLLSQ